MRIIRPLLIFLLLSIPTIILADPGFLDSGFGDGGLVSTNFGARTNDYPRAIVVQTDGNILVAGGGSGHTKMVRYMPSGELDPGFGTAGLVDNAIGDATDMKLLSDGKILVAGYKYNGSDYDFFVARYNPNGLIDTSFGRDGVSILEFSDGSSDLAIALAVAPDGKIVVVGTTSESGFDYKFAVARFDQEGDLDRGFGDEGIFTFNLRSSSGTEVFYDAEVLESGKIIAAGYAPEEDGTGSDFIIARLISDGFLDATFGSRGGYEITTAGSKLYDMQPIPDGKILAVGSSDDGRAALARYLENGRLDTGFRSGGFVLLDAGTMATSVALEPDGKYLIAGGPGFFVTRYRNIGIPDVIFADEGWRSVDFGTGSANAAAIAIDPDTNIYVAGQIMEEAEDAYFDFATAKLFNDRSDIYFSEIEATPNPVNIDSSLTYNLRVSNAGEDVARNVGLAAVLPENVTYMESDYFYPSFGVYPCSYSENEDGMGEVFCNIGAVVNGYDIDVTIIVMPEAGSEVLIPFTLTSATYDFDQTNNTLSLQTAVEGGDVTPPEDERPPEDDDDGAGSGDDYNWTPSPVDPAWPDFEVSSNPTFDEQTKSGGTYKGGSKGGCSLIR